MDGYTFEFIILIFSFPLENQDHILLPFLSILAVKYLYVIIIINVQNKIQSTQK
jgi:hypothetical protein